MKMAEVFNEFILLTEKPMELCNLKIFIKNYEAGSINLQPKLTWIHL